MGWRQLEAVDTSHGLHKVIMSRSAGNTGRGACRGLTIPASGHTLFIAVFLRGLQVLICGVYVYFGLQKRLY